MYIYFWYVRGVNLLLGEDETVFLPLYTSFAVHIPSGSGGGENAGPIWSSGVSMPSARTDVGAAAVGNMIYVVGGVDGFARSVATVEAFDMSNNSWVEVEDLPEALHHMALAVHNNNLYCLGGLEGLSQTPSSSACVFDPDVGSWQKMNPMLSAVGASAAVVHYGEIHVLGGQAAAGVTDLHMIYVPSTRKWSWGEALLTPRSHHSAASWNDKLIVFGGRSGSLAYNLRTTDVLDDGAADWIRWEPMAVKRSGFGTVQTGGTVYAIGGEAPTTTLDKVEMLDFEERQWKLMPPMPTARQGVGVAASGGRIFVTGGGKHPGVSVTDINEVFIPAAYVPSEDE